MQINKNGWRFCKIHSFCCELQLLRLEMENYFIHMDVAASLTVPHLIGRDLQQAYGVLNGQWLTNVGLQMINCLWFVDITLLAWLSKCINTKFVYSSTTVYKQCRYAKLPNNASTINPMNDCSLTALKIHIDDVLKQYTL